MLCRPALATSATARARRRGSAQRLPADFFARRAIAQPGRAPNWRTLNATKDRARPASPLRRPKQRAPS
eukprot:6867019-Alexandrium_andersonii.AAC.1